MICLFTALVLLSTLHSNANENEGARVAELLNRGGFSTYHFVPANRPRAIVLFGSGDGGWGFVENRACTFLRDHSFYVIGIDCRKYAASDYNSAILINDFRVIAEDGLRRSGNSGLPVIYGGWSMGAVQSVAAAGNEQRSPRLLGLLLMSMDARGRYGLRFSDEINISPQGSGTFGVADFSSAVNSLRVVQFEAEGDRMNNSSWMKTLKSPHRLYEVKESNHDFNGVNEDFENQLLDGLDWIFDAKRSPGDELPGRRESQCCRLRLISAQRSKINLK